VNARRDGAVSENPARALAAEAVHAVGELRFLLVPALHGLLRRFVRGVELVTHNGRPGELEGVMRHHGVPPRAGEGRARVTELVPRNGDAPGRRRGRPTTGAPEPVFEHLELDLVDAFPPHPSNSGKGSLELVAVVHRPHVTLSRCSSHSFCCASRSSCSRSPWAADPTTASLRSCSP